MKLCKDKNYKTFKETNIDGLTFKNVEKKASLKSLLKAKKTQITFIKKGVFFGLFSDFSIFLGLFFGQSGLIRSPICFGFSCKIYLKPLDCD